MARKIKTRTSRRINYLYSEDEKNWVEGHQYVNGINEFDKNGNLLKQQSFNRDQEGGEHIEYRYNDHNLVTEELIYFDDNQLAETHFYEYNEAAKVAIERIAYQDGSNDVVQYTYNTAGDLVERKHVDEDEEVEGIERNEYEAGKLICESVFGSEEEKISEAKHTYDESGKLIETLTWSNETDEQIKVIYEYDDQGRQDCHEQYNGSGQIVARTSITYDEKGLITEVLEEDTFSTKTIKFQNDEEGRPVLQEEFNEEEELTLRIERTYDKDGELIESIVYVDRHDQGPEQYYAIRVEFEYWDEE